MKVKMESFRKKMNGEMEENERVYKNLRGINVIYG